MKKILIFILTILLMCGLSAQRIDRLDSLVSASMEAGDYFWIIDVDGTPKKSRRVSLSQIKAWLLSEGFSMIGGGGTTNDTLRISGTTTKTLTLVDSQGDSVYVSFTDIDTQLNESQVDAFVSNNGYSTTDTTLNESEVDAFVANNGYLTSESQTLSFVNPDLSISGGNSVDLSALSGGGGTWGSITGTLSNQTDLQAAIDAKANTSHTHTESDISDLAHFSGSWNDLTNVPAGFADGVDNTGGAGSDGVISNVVFSSPNLTFTGADGGFNGSVDISAINSDTNLTEEEVEDFVGGMVTGNTETLIAVTYDDVGNSLDFVVDNDLANYDNSNSDFIPSNPTGITGATAITNIVQLSQASYDAIGTPDANTLYIIND